MLLDCSLPTLGYPMQNILDRVWGLWADDMGNETLLTSILAQTHADCEMCVGNPWCGASPNPNPNPNPSPNPNQVATTSPSLRKAMDDPLLG